MIEGEHLAIQVPILDGVWRWYRRRRLDWKRRQWEKRGRPVPPPHFLKAMVLRDYASRYNLRVLVETGTYYGVMIDRLKSDFDRIYSIELSRELYEKAKTRFQSDDHIELIQGDSAQELGTVLKRITQPALFWLDGHYSGGVTGRGAKDTPVFEELKHILDRHDVRSVIVIDDARLFGTEPSYPTMDELIAFVRARREDAGITVEADSIRIVPFGHGEVSEPSPAGA